MRDGSSIATLRATRRVWAVGAIHGEATRLERLHDLIWPRLAAIGQARGIGAFTA